MAEEQTNAKPYFGRWVAGAFTAFSGSFLLLLISDAYNAPSRVNSESEERHASQQQYIDAQDREIRVYIDQRINEMSSRLSAVENEVGTEQQEIERIDGRINKVITREFGREQAARRDIARIEEQVKFEGQKVWSYLLEERRERDRQKGN